MANTYTLISSNVLTGTAAFVAFSSIPSTYTDLVLRCSTRDDDSVNGSTILVTFNGDGTSTYSETVMYGTGAAAASTRATNGTKIGQTGYLVGDSAVNTANTFGSFEIYIPNYTVSQTKVLSAISVEESNSASTKTFISGLAGQWRVNTAINNISIGMGSNYFVAGSSFYLYGIKNA